MSIIEIFDRLLCDILTYNSKEVQKIDRQTKTIHLCEQGFLVLYLSKNEE